MPHILQMIVPLERSIPMEEISLTQKKDAVSAHLNSKGENLMQYDY